MEWSHDFCLSCDRQISEGAYCSQACRLADLEKAGASSEPSSPSYLSSSATSTSSYSSNASSHSAAGFHLPPALNFAAFRPQSSARPDYTGHASTTTSHSQHSYYYQQPQSHTYASHSEEPERVQRSLTPSSSRSSLSSISNYQASQGMSQQAASALRGYVSSLDQARDAKRRLHSRT